MKFDVTLAVILVFFVPGMVVLYAIPIELGDSLDMLRKLEKIPSASEIVILLSAALLIGVLIDSLRIVTIQPAIELISRHLHGKELMPDYISTITNERLTVFEMLVNRSYEYYRLNCNLELAFLLLILGYILTCNFGTNLAIAALAAFVWLPVAVRSKRDNNATIRQFVKSYGESLYVPRVAMRRRESTIESSSPPRRY